MINIAIDGYAGSGKTTLVKALAKKLGGDFKVLNTGEIFRGYAYAYNKLDLGGVSLKKIEKLLTETDLRVVFFGKNQHIFVNGEDVSKKLQGEEIGKLASQISTYQEVRAKYAEIARIFAKQYNCLVEGRDIGSYLLPDADVKIFLTAKPEIRAKRRFKDLKKKDKNIVFDDVYADMIERDKLDENKGEFSLRQTEESVVVDDSDMTLEETAEHCLAIINKKISEGEFINIAIDGYVCSGKSTIAKALAKKLGFDVFDTGALYRGIACAFDYMNLDENKIGEKYISAFASQINVRTDFKNRVQHVYVNGIDHTKSLRTERISKLTAKISPFSCIREKILKLQRDFARNHNIVMEGRDIGSHVLPYAQFKFFCTAEEHVRALRRFEQQRAMGNDVKLEDILKELHERDYKDINRENGAVKVLPDSIVIDTTKQSLEQSVEFCLKIIREKYPKL